MYGKNQQVVAETGIDAKAASQEPVVNLVGKLEELRLRLVSEAHTQKRGITTKVACMAIGGNRNTRRQKHALVVFSGHRLGAKLFLSYSLERESEEGKSGTHISYHTRVRPGSCCYAAGVEAAAGPYTKLVA